MGKHELSHEQQIASVRETVESIWIAIVLAFVLRAFVLEAFMIPTGSMAPRLMGKHFQFDCPPCGYHYATRLGDKPGVRQAGISDALEPPDSECPSCRFVRSVSRREYARRQYAFGGDRVLVLKYLYLFRKPRAWDVVVFKNPLNNQENYIKRLIGLPGQQIQIYGGDVYVRNGKDFDDNGVIDKTDFAHPDCLADKDCLWHILHKPAQTQEVMWQIIYDNDYPPDTGLYNRRTSGPEWKESVWQEPGEPKRWDLTDGGGRTFRFNGGGPAAVSFVKDRDWFLDTYAYNGPDHRRAGPNEKNVCNDLKLSFLFVPASADARVGLRISSGLHHFRAWVRATGHVSLEHGKVAGDRVVWDREPWKEVPLAALEVGRGHEIALTHADYRVTLWVNGKAVVTSPDDYGPNIADVVSDGPAPELPVPTVQILAAGGKSRLNHIRLMRDVFYTTPDIQEGRLGWGTPGNPMTLRKFAGKPDLDEFFVLGDNSPNSRDSRMWGSHDPTLRGSEYACRIAGTDGSYAFTIDGTEDGYRYAYHDGTVPRYNMMGKAFFVYWPGGFRTPVLRRLPIVPNVGRMRLIR